MGLSHPPRPDHTRPTENRTEWVAGAPSQEIQSMNPRTDAVRESCPEPQSSTGTHRDDPDPNNDTARNAALPNPLPARVLADAIAAEYVTPPLTDYHAYSAILRIAARSTIRAITEVVE